MPFQDAENHVLSCRPASVPAFAATTEIALVQLNRAVENLVRLQCQMMVDDLADFAVEQGCRIGVDAQNIGSGTGGNLKYKKTEQFFLNFFFNLQCVIFIFRG